MKNRRQFIKTATAGAASLMLPHPAYSEILNLFGGPYFIHLHLGGGWDTSLFCDPHVEINSELKQVAFHDKLGVTHHYGDLTFNSQKGLEEFGSTQEFMDRYLGNMTIFNGIRCQSNGHATAIKIAARGIYSPLYPNISALYSRSILDQLNLRIPLPYMTSTSGADKNTNNLLSAVGIPTASAFNNIVNLNALPANKTLHSDANQELLEVAFRARLENQASHASFLAENQLLSHLLKINQSLDHFKLIQENIEQYPIKTSKGIQQLSSDEVVLACMASGATASASLWDGGWDSHSNNFQVQKKRYQQVFHRIDKLIRAAETMGIKDKIILYVSSDFGRTPATKEHNGGRDHWTIGSSFLWSSSFETKVFGKTNSQLIPEEEWNFTTAHLHEELRDILKIDSDLRKRYELSVNSLGLMKA